MADAAEMMSQVMIQGVTGKLTAGEVDEAIVTADRFIAGFAGRDGPAMGAFGATLASLHFLRGTARRAKGVAAQDTPLLAAAEEDLQRGLALMQQHGSPSDAATMSRLLEGVRAAGGGAPQVIAAFVEGARALQPSARKGAGGAGGGRLLQLVIWTILGGLLWVGAVALFLWTMRTSGARSLWMFLGVVPLYLLIYAGLKGWSWYSQYSISTVGGMLKCLAFLFLGVSGVGTLPAFYWTGKGVWETFGERS